jgi:DNA-binding CsgD family transcriptional regulator
MRPQADGLAGNAAILGDTLSSRELEVLAMTSAGCTNSEIAKRLNVTVHAVKFHLGSVYRKLGVANRTEAAVAFLQSTEGTVRGKELS